MTQTDAEAHAEDDGCSEIFKFSTEFSFLSSPFLVWRKNLVQFLYLVEMKRLSHPTAHFIQLFS